MDGTSRWLTTAEQRSWRSFARMHHKLRGTLDRDLQEHTSLSAADYPVLVALTDAPDGRRRLQDLAKELEQEQSRVSHHVNRMARRGLVTREKCGDDRRGVFVVVTPAGREAIAAAAPHHVATVRRLVIDALTPEELGTLARISGRILERMDQTDQMDKVEQ